MLLDFSKVLKPKLSKLVRLLSNQGLLLMSGNCNFLKQFFPLQLFSPDVNFPQIFAGVCRFLASMLKTLLFQVQKSILYILIDWDWPMLTRDRRCFLSYQLQEEQLDFSFFNSPFCTFERIQPRGNILLKLNNDGQRIKTLFKMYVT